MKFFTTNITKNAPRIGLITELPRLPNFKIETPTAFLYTKGGSVPHISREVLKLITNEQQQCLQVSLANTLNFQESLKHSNYTLAEFVGLPECFVYSTVHDVGDITPSGHHLQSNIPVWTRSGKVYINPDSYMNAIKAYKPDMYCLLADLDTNIASSKKRIAKSVDQTIDFAEKCLELHSKSEILKNSKIIVSLAGGFCLKSREKCIKCILKENKHIFGYSISGLHNNGPEMELLPFSDLNDVVELTINLLPEDKLRIVEGCWNPVNILKFIKKGIDIFDTSYLHLVTERQAALTFVFDLNNMLDIDDTIYEINLKDSRYREDFRSLQPGCTCLSCTKYTRSYIHHLINVQELLGPVLLSIHNIHFYQKFFHQIRQCITEGKLDQLENYVESQFENHKLKSTNSAISVRSTS